MRILNHSPTKFDEALKESFREDLRSKVMFVRFTKKNGDRRDMVCTLNQDVIPLEHQPAHSGTTFIPLLLQEDIDKPENHIQVYDVEASAWRSIIFDSIELYIENRSGIGALL